MAAYMIFLEDMKSYGTQGNFFAQANMWLCILALQMRGKCTREPSMIASMCAISYLEPTIAAEIGLATDKTSQ